MRKTIPSYTIFTCDCCGREQDDCAHQIKKLENAPDAGEPFMSYEVSLSAPFVNLDMQVCEECAQRIHDAIQDVIRKASSEATQEQLAIIARTHS